MLSHQTYTIFLNSSLHRKSQKGLVLRSWIEPVVDVELAGLAEDEGGELPAFGSF